MTEVARCGRPTRRGGACRLRLVLAVLSCANHLTADERVEYDRRRSAPSPFDRISTAVVEPACWTWPLVPVEQLAQDVLGDVPAMARLVVQEASGEAVIERWQQGRCAVCGIHSPGRLVLDHDHATALIRGWLCRSCNVREPHAGGIFAQYRQRNPASILGIRERYWSEVAEALDPQSLRPTPPPGDQWQKNPAAGIGL